MSKINVKLMTNECLETLRNRASTVVDYLKKNKNDSSWISEIYKGTIYEEVKYEIEDFELKVPIDENDKETDFINSIILYERLKDLPKYLITNERFWSWINFEKGYKAALVYIDINDEKTFLQHWLFHSGIRRGLYFGVLSRCYFRVELTIDDNKEDKYELTKYVIEKPERFRNYTWRTYSGNKKIIKSCLKATKQIEDANENISKVWSFSEIAKFVSKLGSVMFLDVIPGDEITDRIIAEYKKQKAIKESSDKAA